MKESPVNYLVKIPFGKILIKMFLNEKRMCIKLLSSNDEEIRY